MTLFLIARFINEIFLQNEFQPIAEKGSRNP